MVVKGKEKQSFLRTDKGDQRRRMNADRAQQNMVDAPECKVSVLCATFNHEDYLRQTLDSFVAQKTDFP